MKNTKLRKLDLGAREMLTRSQMKNVRGGDGSGGSGGYCGSGACTLTIQGSDGNYITRNGHCDQSSIMTNAQCYCETGIGMIPVTSNGGVSRCHP